MKQMIREKAGEYRLFRYLFVVITILMTLLLGVVSARAQKQQTKFFNNVDQNGVILVE